MCVRVCMYVHAFEARRYRERESVKIQEEEKRREETEIVFCVLVIVVGIENIIFFSSAPNAFSIKDY